MPTINENQFFTVLIEFAVEPSQQQAFIDAIADQVNSKHKTPTSIVPNALFPRISQLTLK